MIDDICSLQGSTSSTSSVGSSSSTDSMEVSTRNGLSTKAPTPRYVFKLIVKNKIFGSEIFKVKNLSAD